ncbi:oxidoreductase [Rhodococcus triatomae]|uniref:Ferredoxin-NADP reductase n=1 Tax=Rhodococcus triatomae TaxID=300028 RepID=A0A1G8L463_9NOCA|nr:PDR/VanB family oxidoreductase [Rhodococcus triatomae]QNG20500.1 oxidoreductase [Rhodococcus triatomae]QNG23582.1 oxidoreductase [Rhodococcus triatomae]SDI50381.1 Ferredoxin-NADP reductase [Rhodococcus triatomae]
MSHPSTPQSPTSSPSTPGTPAPTGPGTDSLEVVVIERRTVAHDVVELTLARPDRSVLPPWAPGAHLDLVLAEDLVRQYSLCGTPEERSTFMIAVRREAPGRGGSARVHDDLRVGARVRVRPPRNHFPLVRAAGYVLVAGGIGITPMLALARAAAASGRSWQLHYCGRGADRMPYAGDLVAAWPGQITLHDSVTEGRWDPRTALSGLERGTAVYCCGPTGLLSAVEEAVAPLPAVDVFTERFVPPAPDTAATARPFEVHLATSGRTLSVPTDRSILDVVEEADLLAASSCREGICGTCEVEVVSGEIEHRDAVLTPEERAEGETMMICVSRACGPRLVLDL